MTNPSFIHGKIFRDPDNTNIKRQQFWFSSEKWRTLQRGKLILVCADFNFIFRWKWRNRFFNDCLFSLVMAITSGEGMQGPSSQFNCSESPHHSLSSSGDVVTGEIVRTACWMVWTRNQKQKNKVRTNEFKETILLTLMEIWNECKWSERKNELKTKTRLSVCKEKWIHFWWWWKERK